MSHKIEKEKIKHFQCHSSLSLSLFRSRPSLSLYLSLSLSLSLSEIATSLEETFVGIRRA